MPEIEPGTFFMESMGATAELQFFYVSYWFHINYENLSLKNWTLNCCCSWVRAQLNFRNGMESIQLQKIKLLWCCLSCGGCSVQSTHWSLTPNYTKQVSWGLQPTSSAWTSWWAKNNINFVEIVWFHCRFFKIMNQGCLAHYRFPSVETFSPGAKIHVNCFVLGYLSLLILYWEMHLYPLFLNYLKQEKWLKMLFNLFWEEEYSCELWSIKLCAWQYQTLLVISSLWNCKSPHSISRAELWKTMYRTSHDSALVWKWRLGVRRPKAGGIPEGVSTVRLDGGNPSTSSYWGWVCGSYQKTLGRMQCTHFLP